jgi:multidrug efflux pump subunit AcrA (membrane-fusion protein)
MTKNKPLKLTCGGLFLSALAVTATAQTQPPEAAPAAAQQQPSQGQLTREQRGFTRPSQTAKLSPMFPGIVREVKVKKGDRVKVGDVILVQDDRIEIERLKGLKIEAESEIRIEAARTDMEAKKKALERVQQMYKNGASSDLELE